MNPKNLLCNVFVFIINIRDIIVCLSFKFDYFCLVDKGEEVNRSKNHFNAIKEKKLFSGVSS